MVIWLVRILVLVASPLISYFQISRTTHGILIGLAFALVMILAEIVIQKIPLDTLIAGILGVIFGLIGAKLLDYSVYLMDNVRVYEIMKDYSLLIKVIFSYLGLVIAVNKKSELDLLDKDILGMGRHKKADDLILLDTSAVIDGRISDIAETKFISGTLVVPRFVIQELQSLADSSDTHKRNRARRGLDIIAKLQKDETLTVKIFDKDFPELNNVDAKLLALSKELTAKIVTTDFNLNKVAVLQGATVLNINDLSNALKPVYLPGETMPIFVVKDGKEHNQGIGYLDDGTMVVVEEGRRFVGKRIDVIVSSILQTSSGRMVFTRPAPQQGGESQPVQEIRETRDVRENRDNREVREYRENRDRENRENREPRRENRDNREPRRDNRDNRDQRRDNREPRENRENPQPSGNRENRESRDQGANPAVQEKPEYRENREPAENRENPEQRENREDQKAPEQQPNH